MAGLSGLAIRADASAAIGQGHVMRTLALAQAWQDMGGAAAYLCAHCPEALARRLSDEGVAVEHVHSEPGSPEDAAASAKLCRRMGSPWLVADGYAFGGAYQRAIKDLGLNLLVLDDYGHAEHYFADLVLNQNLDAPEGLYNSREKYTCLLLGSKYGLIRREFLAKRLSERRHPQRVANVLVTMGGADIAGLTPLILEALEQVDAKLQILAAVGESNPRYESLRAYAAHSRQKVEVKSGVYMPQAMAWADFCFSAAGSTCWELCFMGCPTAVVVCADNQRDIAGALAAHGAAIHLGEARDLNVDRVLQSFAEIMADKAARESLAANGGRVVDGRGALRILAAMGYES